MTPSITHAPPPAASAADVPVLDLAPLLAGEDIDGLAREVRRACEGMAFFYIRNHGIPAEVIEEAFTASRRFFEQPLDARMKIHKDRFHRGYLPLGTTRYPGKAADLKDSFDLGVDLPLNHPDVVGGLPLHGPNQWPELEGFRAPVEAYFQAVRDCGLRLLTLFARSLKVSDDFFTRHYDNPTILMRMLHYPPQSEALEEDSIGAFPHSDYGVMTLLAQDPSGGLELKKPDESWVGAPFIPGTFVVNIGDLMARWTNDVYRSNQHQVVNRLATERYSIPFFFNPNHRALVECIPSCTGPSRPPLYPPVGAGEYVANKIRTNQNFKS